VNGDAPPASDLPVQIASPGIGPIDPVATPHYPTTGQLMYAVGGQSGSQNLYGLFSDQDGSNLSWKQVGSVSSGVPGDSISALAALNNGTVMVGTGAGKFFILELRPGGLVVGQALPVSPPPGIPTGQVNRIVWSSASSSPIIGRPVPPPPPPPPGLPFWSAYRAFAIFNTAAGGAILRFDGTSWSPVDPGLPGGPYYGLAADGFGRIWTSTDDRVFVSRDGGVSWKDASRGLPLRAHCRELRYNLVQQNSPSLYLSTYGRSVWVTDV
jgi:hypothetical protein